MKRWWTVVLYENDGFTEEKTSEGSLSDYASDEIGGQIKDKAFDIAKDKIKKSFEDKHTAGNDNLSGKGLSGNEADIVKNGTKMAGKAGENAGQVAEAAGGAAESAGTAATGTGTAAGGGAAAAGGTAAGAGTAAAGTAATGAAAAGSTATGVGIPIAIILTAINAGKAAGKSVESLSEKGTMEDDYKFLKGGIGVACAVIIILVVFIYEFCGALIRFITPGPVESYRESQFETSETIRTDFLKDDYPTVKAVISSYNGLEEYSKEQLNKNAIDVYVAVLDAAITDIFYEYVDETLEDFSHPLFVKFIIGDDIQRDDERTRENFLSQPYPYCKKRSDGYVYTIRDFIGTTHPETEDLGTYETIPAYSFGAIDYLNNDVNYAEILAVFAMKEDFTFDANNNTLEQFARLLCSEKTKKLLYEIKAERVDYEDEIEEEVEVSKGIFKKIKYLIKKYYLTFTVKPYGLRELFMIAEVDRYATDPNFKYFTNLEMFDRKENYLRTFAEDGLERLGPGYDEPRDESSLIYADGATTGRSLEYYIYDADNLEEWQEENPEWDYGNIPPNPIEITYTTGAKIIDMPNYINQGTCAAADIRRGNSATTIRSAGCLDCSQIMVAQYYIQQYISVSSIAQNTSMYVGDAFNGTEFYSKYGLRSDGNQSFNIDTIRAYIDKGMPVIFHIRGYWNFNGVTYHKTQNGHFLVIMGYDNDGFYVYDPGSNNNTQNGPIPYAAFYYVADKHIRVPYKNGFTPRFKQ